MRDLLQQGQSTSVIPVEKKMRFESNESVTRQEKKKLCPKLWIHPNQITVLQDYRGGEGAENQEVQFP